MAPQSNSCLYPLINYLASGGGSNSEDRPQNMGAPQSVTYNDFFYNMLQAGEVAEITIFPGEDRENRAIILLRQGAMYKVRIICI